MGENKENKMGLISVTRDNRSHLCQEKQCPRRLPVENAGKSFATATDVSELPKPTLYTSRRDARFPSR